MNKLSMLEQLKNALIVRILIGLFILISIVSVRIIDTSAQSNDEGWTTPINLSNSGSTTNPQLVVDSNGTFHVIWIDAFDGYVYAQSGDGERWSTPIPLSLPFQVEDSPPLLLADASGFVHAFWIDEESTMYYSRILGTEFGNPAAWQIAIGLAESALDLDAVIDSGGNIHLSYARPLSTEQFPSGIYYRRSTDGGQSWSNSISLYQSQYFRSLQSRNANLDIFASNVSPSAQVSLVWNDHSLKRIFFVSSQDSGLNWGSVQEIVGPDNIFGNDTPFNPQIASVEESTLLLYQIGMPGGQCTQFSQWSIDGGATWEEPKKILNEFPVCPHTSEIIRQNSDYFILMLDIFDDLTFMAWNGLVWSEPQPQLELSAFQNPKTLDSVLYRCRQVKVVDNDILVVGCDQGIGGDIWFTSGSFGSIDEWFPSPILWSSSENVVDTTAKISALTSVAEKNDNTHVFWVESSISEAEENYTIKHTQWDGTQWTIPNSVRTGVGGAPTQLSSSSDGSGRLLLTWVDGDIGQLYFRWVNADKASLSSEWSQPQSLLPSLFTISNPRLLADSAGKIVIVYAIPFNEKRGIYLIRSEDHGSTWSEPKEIFSALSANWDLVNQPKINLSADGRLHLLLTRYSVQGQPIGLFYTQSSDGGATWNQIEEVVDTPVFWSEVTSFGAQTIHRFWQEWSSSLYVNFHQVSEDGGQTWENPTIVSYASGLSAPPSVTIDQVGGLHFNQMSNPENLMIQYSRWDGSRWLKDSDIRLRIAVDANEDHFIATSITPLGYLRVFVSVSESNQSGFSEQGILTYKRFLELLLIEEEQSAVIPIMTIPTATAEEIELQATPTTSVLISDLSQQQPPIDRNRLGIILSAILVIATLSAGLFYYPS
jgi:hypothetical protein